MIPNPKAPVPKNPDTIQYPKKPEEERKMVTNLFPVIKTTSIYVVSRQSVGRATPRQNGSNDVRNQSHDMTAST